MMPPDSIAGDVQYLKCSPTYSVDASVPPRLQLYIPQITREAQLIEQEKMHINALLAEGKTRQEIAQMGLYSALDPNVMGDAAS